MKEFIIGATTYTMSESGYCYKMFNGKKTRIGKAEFEAAQVELVETTVEAVKETETTAEVEAIATEMKPKAKKTTKTDNANKPKKKRRPKDIAHESNGVTLTAKQVDFIQHLPDSDFWENGVDSAIWVDCLCDEIGGQFANKPMTVGAMISTLCEKGLGVRAKEKPNGKTATSFKLTDLGKKVALALGVE